MALESPDHEGKRSSVDKEKHELDLSTYAIWATPLHGYSSLSLTTEEIEAIAVPDFDDPNLDKDAAIQGVLGQSSSSLQLHEPCSTRLCRRGRFSLS